MKILFVVAVLSIMLTSSCISMVTHPQTTMDSVKLLTSKKTIEARIENALKAQQDSIARANGDAKSVSY